MSINENLPPGVKRMKQAAALRGLEVEVVARQPADNLSEAATLMGIEPRDIVKTMVVKRKDGSFFFALIPGDRVISWPKLRSLLGVNKLSLPHADVAYGATGYERGTITPLGSSIDWPVYADLGVDRGRMCLGSGSHGYSTFVDSTALISALGATLADISDPEPVRLPSS